MDRTRKKMKLNVFSYSDYREFLKDWCKAAKEDRRSISYRWLAKRAGFKSESYFQLIVNGKRNLTNETMAKVITLLNLNKQESEYFRNLVGFNQAKKQEEKDYFYQKILGIQKYRETKPMAKDQYEFFSKWYYPMVREIVNLRNFDNTPEWIAMNIQPPISTDEAREALSLLERLGLIKKKGKKWVQTDARLSTGSEVSSLFIMKYHQEVLRMAADIIPNINYSVRDVSAVNASCSKETADKIKKRIRQFRKSILKLISMDKSTETCIMLNIQMFPFIKYRL